MRDTLTRFTAAASPTIPSPASLVVIHGTAELGKRYPLTGDLAIGRDGGNDLVLELPDVSRRHARIQAREGRWYIRDLGSTNGTLVGEEPVRGETELASGALIRVGGAILKYLSGGNVEALFHEEMYRLSVKDGLTGVHNRRYLMDFLDREVARANRYGSPLWLALMDLDHFKQINDRHGHLLGDQVLQRLAARVARRVRREQLFARYGGEEFALVLPELGAPEVRAFCEAVRAEVAAERTAGVAATVSLGAAGLRPGTSRADLMAAADAQLYRAKQAGRDRVCLADA